MTLTKQVLSDILKEIVWIVLYGLLAAIALQSAVLMARYYKDDVIKNSYINTFLDNNVYSLQVQDYSINPEHMQSVDTVPSSAEPSGTPNQNAPLSLAEYFEKGLSPEGKLGGYIRIPYAKGKIEELIVFAGKYADLTGYKRPEGKSLALVVSPDLEELVGETLQFSTEKLTIDAAIDFDFYHPYYHEFAFLNNHERTLYVFSDDTELLKKLFPQAMGDLMLEKLIIVNPTKEELVELRTVAYNETRQHLYLESMNGYFNSIADPSSRSVRAELLFYGTASIALIGVMVLNMLRALNFIIQDCATHHLFGATGLHVFMRMLLYVTSYNIIPFVAIIKAIKIYDLFSIGNVVIVSIALLTLILTITIIKYKQFKSNFSQGLRRD